MTKQPHNIRHGNEDIVRLNPMEHVRKRPGMYIGGTDSKALHYLIYEIVDNAIDLAFAGQCNHVWVTLRDNNEVCICDNGPGISTSVKPSGKSVLEDEMTQIGIHSERLPATRTYFTGNYRRIGFAAVNALSENMLVETAYDGFLWQQRYQQGKVQNAVSMIHPLSSQDEIGLSFTFQPDFTIFEPNQFDFNQIATRFQELSFLVKGLTFSLCDERNEQIKEVDYYSEVGIVGYVANLNTNQTPLHDILHTEFETFISREYSKPYAIKVDFALQYTNSQDCAIKCFVNTIEVTPDGQYARAVCSTLTNILNGSDVYRRNKKQYSIEEATRGFTLVMHILHPSPSYHNAITSEVYIEPELYGRISEIVFREFGKGMYVDPVSEWLAGEDDDE